MRQSLCNSAGSVPAAQTTMSLSALSSPTSVADSRTAPITSASEGSASPGAWGGAVVVESGVRVGVGPRAGQGGRELAQSGADIGEQRLAALFGRIQRLDVQAQQPGLRVQRMR